MKVYRVERQDGLGPYRPDVPDEVTDTLYNWRRGDNHPTPDDGGLVMRKTDLYGFTSKRALHTWFAGAKRVLRKHGFLLATYSVPAEHVRRGDRQVAFPKKHATLIDRSTLI